MNTIQRIANPDIYRQRDRHKINITVNIHVGFLASRVSVHNTEISYMGLRTMLLRFASRTIPTCIHTFSSLEILLSIDSGIMTRMTAVILMMMLRGSARTGGSSW
jgi:hypothetical protein